MSPRAPQQGTGESDALDRASERFLRSIDEPDAADWPLDATPEEKAAWRAVTEGWNAVGAVGSSPEMIALRTAALKSAARAERRRSLRQLQPARWVAWGAFAATITAAAMLGVYAHVQTQPASTQTVETAVGERRTITLADRSRVVLDEGSRLAITYRRRSRDLELLRGQAEFDVATDQLRPFSVVSGNRRVVATGTVFTVDLLPGALTVTLLEGAVVVGREDQDPAGSEVVTLRPSERLVVDRVSGAMAKTKVDSQEVEAWKNGKLIFEGEALDAAIARVNRYSPRPVVLADPSQAKRPVTGVFNAGDGIAFAEGVSVQLPLKVRTRGELVELAGR